MCYRQVERKYSHLFLHHFTVPAVVSKTESGKCFIKVEPGHPWGLQSVLYLCVCVCTHTHTCMYFPHTHTYVFLPPYSSNLSHARFFFLRCIYFSLLWVFVVARLSVAVTSGAALHCSA